MTTAERFKAIDNFAEELNAGNITLAEFQKQATIKANGILSRSTRQMAMERIQKIVSRYLKNGGK